jgi:hypothetical protein
MHSKPQILQKISPVSKNSAGREQISSLEHSLKPVLAMSCSILGAKGAWIVRKDEGGNQVVAADTLAWEMLLATLADVIVSGAEKNGPGQNGNVAMAEGQLFCSDLVTPCHADGIVYYFGILFDKKYRLKSFNRGLIDGFRCSLNALIPH